MVDVPAVHVLRSAAAGVSNSHVLDLDECQLRKHFWKSIASSSKQTWLWTQNQHFRSNTNSQHQPCVKQQSSIIEVSGEVRSPFLTFAHMLLAYMVILWLLAGVNARRCLDPKPLPFQGGRRARRVVKHVVSSSTVQQALQELAAETVGGDAAYIYGVVDLSVHAAYNHKIRLSQVDREQCWYWRSMGVPAADLWCFEINRFVSLQQPIPASEYIAKRFSRVFTVLKHGHVEELCFNFPEIPAWLRAGLAGARPDDVHLAALIPEPFCILTFKMCLQYLVLPSPVSRVVACS